MYVSSFLIRTEYDDKARTRLRHGYPFDRNSRFQGRSNEMKKLEVHFSDQSSMRRAAISGLGGVGKSQLALEFVYRHQDDYSMVLWVDAPSKTAVENAYCNVMQRLIDMKADEALGRKPDFEKIGRRLGILGLINNEGRLLVLDDSSVEMTRIVEGVKEWLSKGLNDSWLMIFDNHDEPLSFNLRQYFPSSPKGSIIITTRDPEVVDYTSFGLPLEGLDEESAIKLLLGIAQRDSEDPQGEMTFLMLS